MPPEVTETDPDGVDYGWVMQVTFLTSLAVGVPIVIVLSIPFALESWTARAMFVVRVGAVIWFLTAVLVYLYARKQTD